MPDVATIGLFISSVKNAADIAKAIREAGISLEKAEIKLKMAELIESLAEAKLQAVEIQELIQEKDKRIAELEKALEFKAKLVRSNDAYYESNDNGEPHGDPYCLSCWEREHMAIHLYNHLTGEKACPNCKRIYQRKRVPSIS
jgi:hypothetical protein